MHISRARRRAWAGPAVSAAVNRQGGPGAAANIYGIMVMLPFPPYAPDFNLGKKKQNNSVSNKIDIRRQHFPSQHDAHCRNRPRESGDDHTTPPTKSNGTYVDSNGPSDRGVKAGRRGVNRDSGPTPPLISGRGLGNKPPPPPPANSAAGCGKKPPPGPTAPRGVAIGSENPDGRSGVSAPPPLPMTIAVPC